MTGALPLAGANTAVVGVAGFQSTSLLAGAQGVQLGDPCIAGVKLRVPLVFPPNINVRIRVRNGNAFTVQQYGSGAATTPVAQDTIPTSQFLAVRQYLRGYLCTMPV